MCGNSIPRSTWPQSRRVTSDSTSYDTLEITSLPSIVSEEYLELYFNSSKSGGCDDEVKSIAMIQPGMAHVQFHDPKGNNFSITFPLFYSACITKSSTYYGTFTN